MFYIVFTEMLLQKKLEHIVSNYDIKKVLDLWCWNWKYCLFFEKYWSTVVWVDNMSLNIWREKSKDFPESDNITFVNDNIEDFIITEKYDIVLLINVINFLDTDFLFNWLFQKISTNLNKSGFVILTIFLDTAEQKSIYNLDKFCYLEDLWLKIVDKGFIQKLDNHPPIWEHKHNILYLFLQNI